MELRELRYFLAVAQEESISRAAEYLFIAQPSLSKQMQNLERELGQQLFVRGSRRIKLTEAGMLLRKRAQEIIELYEKTESELLSPLENVSGEVHIGGGESYAMRLVARAAKDVQTRHPRIKFHFFSGDTIDVTERLDKGLIDFAVLVEPADLSKYDYLRLPAGDTWGILMRKDSPLAQKEYIAPEDIRSLPLIHSKHAINKKLIRDWYRTDAEHLNIVATYNLIYNASLLVEEGMGYVIGLDKLINTTGSSALCFRPFRPGLETHLDIAWKKYSVFSKAGELFLSRLQELLAVETAAGQAET